MTESTSSAQLIDPGALDAAMNHAILKVRYEGERAQAHCNLEPGGSESALWELLKHRAPDVYAQVHANYSFEIGVEVARLVIQSPLSDVSAGVAAIVDQAIKNERESRRAA